ncbi:MAG: sensor domain-containing diguanylate cyclase [Thermoanaerobaculia bacterium]|jgi:diguanylate cyclase (GGDEF)-like protein
MTDHTDEPATGDAAQFALLNEIVRIAMQDLRLEAMLQRITDALARSFSWQFVACVGTDLDRNRFVCHALTTSLETEINVGYSRPIGSGVVGQVARSGEPIVIDDVRESPIYVETTKDVCSEICVPVKHAGRVVAILNIEDTRQAAFHGKLPLLEAIAAQVGGAIASARLHESLRRRADQVEMISELSRLALQAVEISAILDRVTRFVHERFDLVVTSFLLADETRSSFTLASRQGTAPVESGTTTWPASVGIVGRALRSGERQLVLDVRRDPDYFPIDEAVVAEYVIPAMFQGQLLGVLNLESRAIDTFSRENLLVFDMLVDHVAGAVYLASMNRRLGETSRALEEANRLLQGANDELHRLSTTDPLTGVANRRRLDEQLDAEWRRASRNGAPLTVMMIDVDHFKAFNDRYGHQRGDECLARVARALGSQVHRAGELLARYGGEEFALLTVVDPAAARVLAERLREEVERLAIDHAGAPGVGHVTVSIGVATVVPSQAENHAGLVASADLALYAAKSAGRNLVVFADSQAR